MAMGDHSAGSAVGCDALHRPSHHLLTRKERSRDLAQKRRLSFKHLMDELAEHLPLAKDVVDQMDHNSCLRVALSFVRMKTFMMAKGAVAKETKRNAAGGAMRPQGAGGCGMRGVQKECPSEVAQELMTEALDGFMMITQFDGEIVYISENVHSHLKLFHSECIGGSLYDLVSEDDHEELKTNLAKIEAETLYKRSEGSTTTSFFCRMKCLRFKVSNYAAKPSGYKLMLISGRPSTAGSEHFFVAMVAPVAPPAILEVRSGYNVFVTHYALDMKCTFFDGRLQQLHGYSKGDLIGHVPFEFHHHDDIKITLQCSQGLMTKGEGLSGYYRYLTRHGNFIWMQSHATMIHDNRTGDPSYIVCVNFIINDDVEQPEQLTLNQATSGTSELSFVQHPFPILLGDGEMMNPLDADSSETVGGDIAPTKSRGSPADETSSSSGMVFPAGSSPTASCTLNTSPSSSVPLPDSGVDDVSPEFIFVGVSPVQSHPPPPPSLSPLSDYGYSSPSFQVNLPTWVPSPAPPPSLSPFSNGSPTTSEHSTNQRPMTLDTPMLSPHPSSILPPITTTQQSPDHHHLNPSPSLPHHSPMPSPQYRASSSSSPSEAIGSYANYGHTGNTQDSLRRHSTSLFIQDRMDSRQYAPTSPGGLCDEDGETGRSMWGCHEMEEEGTLLPMLTQDDLNMLDLLGPMNTWA